MKSVLHLLRSEPDETVASLITAMSGSEGTTVVSLYPDDVSGSTVDWYRLMDDIFNHDQIICWW